MLMVRTICSLLAFSAAVVSVASEEASVATAARKHYSQAAWQEKSVLSGDFTCRGKRELAILGTSEKFIVIAVFTDGLQSKPQILEYSATTRVAKWAVLTKEPLDFDLSEFGSSPSNVPPGLVRSKTCYGLNLSDENADSAHIYWNAKSKIFRDWVL